MGLQEKPIGFLKPVKYGVKYGDAGVKSLIAIMLFGHVDFSVYIFQKFETNCIVQLSASHQRPREMAYGSDDRGDRGYGGGGGASRYGGKETIETVLLLLLLKSCCLDHLDDDALAGFALRVYNLLS